MKKNLTRSLVGIGMLVAILGASPAAAQPVLETDLDAIRFRTDIVQELWDTCWNMSDYPTCPFKNTYEYIDDTITGIGSVGGSGDINAGTVRASCAYVATAGGIDPDTNTILVDAQASASANSPLNPPISTRVWCYPSEGDGQVGITMYGREAQIAGTLSFDRHLDPDLCVSASASYLGGQVANLEPDPTCGPIRGVNFAAGTAR